MHNADVVEGEAVHNRVDTPSPAEFPEELFAEGRENIRSLALEDAELGICGVIDLLKKNPDNSWSLYDYKRGSPLRNAAGELIAKEADALQIKAYACLAECHGMRISHGVVFYAETRTFVPVNLANKEKQLQEVIDCVRDTIQKGMPLPLENDNRCLFCSMYPVCLPDETRVWRNQRKQSGTIRPPVAEDDPGEILIVQNPRAWLSKKGNTIVVSENGTQISVHPLHLLRSIFLYGAAQLSTQLIQTCLTNGIQVSFFSPAGKYIGRLDTLSISGLDSRFGQYKFASHEAMAVKVGHAIIRAKISNQRTLLLRNMKIKDSDALKMLAAIKNMVGRARTRDELMGIEGRAAAIYFAHFSSMLNNPFFAQHFNGRNRRPPRDPVNAMLSLGYSVLSSEVAGICAAVGLDSACGFLHTPRFGRPSFALDMMEEFRPLIVDSVVISLVNKGYVGEDDFVFSSQGCALKKSGHQAFWNAYAKRMAEELTHPTFHYKMNYRRLIEIQIRQIWRIFRGDQSSYHPIITR